MADSKSDQIKGYQSPEDLMGFNREEHPSWTKEEVAAFRKEKQMKDAYLTLRQRTLLASREAKWERKFVENVPKGKRRTVADSEKIKRWFRKGIPHKFRGEMWFRASGADELMMLNKGQYQQHLKKQSKPGDPLSIALSQIDKDLFRTFPDNAQFQLRSDQKAQRADDPNSPVIEAKLPPMLRKLRRILRATAVAMPSIGYCQGMNFIVGTLILVLKREEPTFWLMQTIFLRLIPRYHTQDMHLMRIDQMTLESLLKKRDPQLVAHINANGFSVQLVTTRVFATLFVGALPMDTLFRVWDAFFREGSKILFRVALALFKINRATLMAKVDDPMQLYRHLVDMGKYQYDQDQLMNVAFNKISLTRGEIDTSRKHLTDLHHQKKISQTITSHDSTSALNVLSGQSPTPVDEAVAAPLGDLSGIQEAEDGEANAPAEEAN